MTQIDNLTDQADQTTLVALPDGSVMQLELIFEPTTERWAFNLTHPTLTVTGVAICNHPNMLRQWRNLISFGLACTTLNGIDPTNFDDFSNGNASLFVLSQADVEDVEANIFGGVLQ